MIFALRMFLLLILGLVTTGFTMEKIIEQVSIPLPNPIIIEIAKYSDDKTAAHWFSVDKRHKRIGEAYYAKLGIKVWEELFPDINPPENWTGFSMLYKYRNCLKLLRKKIEIEFYERKGDNGSLKKRVDNLEVALQDWSTDNTDEGKSLGAFLMFLGFQENTILKKIYPENFLKAVKITMKIYAIEDNTNDIHNIIEIFHKEKNIDINCLLKFYQRRDDTKQAFWDGIVKNLPTSVGFTCRLLPKDVFKIMENKPLKCFLLDELPIEICVRACFALDSVSEYIDRNALDEVTIINLVPTFEYPLFWKKKSKYDRCNAMRPQFLKYHISLIQKNREIFNLIFFSKRDKKKKKLFDFYYCYYLRVGYSVAYKTDTQK